MPTTIKRWIYFFLVAGSVIGIDQAAKWRVSHDLLLGQSWEPIPWLRNFLLITHSFNTGAAFGMFSWASDVILVIVIITVIAFVISFPRLPDRARFSRLGVGLIIGGAVSNGIDRIFIGHVVDFVHVQIFNFSNISNFADHAVTLGVALLLLEQWMMERGQMRQRAALIERVEAWMLPFALGPEAPGEDDPGWLSDPEMEPEADDSAGYQAQAGRWLPFLTREPVSVRYDESPETDSFSG